MSGNEREPVSVVHWNPRRPTRGGRLGKVISPKRPVDNFGDLLGPLLVERISQPYAVVPSRGLAIGGGDPVGAAGGHRLLTVGSILHFAEAGDVVWGSGVNGKYWGGGIPEGLTLDVRAVRGPITRSALLHRGITAPAVYGDPGLLWSRYWPREHYLEEPLRPVGVVPNLHDQKFINADDRIISPVGDPHKVISRIAHCELIVASSLHGIVLAESFGIPARLLAPTAEPMHKYFDYYQGTGRKTFTPAATIAEAVLLGGEPAPQWDAEALLGAFPDDLWQTQ